MKITITVLFILLVNSLLFAGTTGKISGVVSDAETGEPIAAANVVLHGTDYGASTDLDGFYYIIQIPPGIYAIEFSILGYAGKLVRDVVVNIDKTTAVDAELTGTAVIGQVVTVTAEKPIVEVDRTFATSTVDVKALEALPITRVQEAVDIQAGVVDGHFRGGRKGEVVYMVDDIPVQDVYDNTQGTTVNQSAVQELQVISGTFNAEYGQAMSGIVNMVTKDGSDTYSGQLSMNFGDYLTTHDDIFFNSGDISPLHIQNYDGSISGPVPSIPKLTFFLNGRLEDSEGWYYGQRRWGMEHDVLVRTGSIVDFVPVFGDSSAVSMNPDYNVYLYGKLSYPIKPTLKLKFSSLWEDRNYRDYDHGWRYVPDGDYRRHRRSRTNILKLTTVLNRSAFLDFAASNTYTEYFHHVFEDPFDDGYVHPVYQEKPNVTLQFGGNKLEHFRRFSNTHGFQGKLAWQVTPVHYVVTGANVSLNTIYYKQFNIIHTGDEYIKTENPNEHAPIIFNNTIEDPSGVNTDIYEYQPFEASFFVQDKVEMRKFIVNLGLRFDYFDPDGRLLADPQDPNIYNPLLESRRDDTIAERETYWYDEPTSKMQLSPRLGIAYPISTTGVLHFAYGHFFQRPKYEYLYTNPDFEIEPGQTINTLMGNADLDAEKTISYEFGLQQGLTEDVSASVSIFMRNILSLVSSDKIITTYDAGTKYTQFTNRDFGEVRGIVLSLDQRFINNLSGGVDYTYQVAEGNASEPGDAFNAAKGNKEPIKQLLPLDWDRRHTVNLNLNYAAPTWGASLIGTYGSGLPYTSEAKGDDSPVEVLFENDARKPAYFNVDISGYQILTAPNVTPRITFEFNIRNLFDRLNENDVFKDTGRATYTRDEELLKHQELAFINTLEELYNHPEYYSRPREVRFGLRVNF